MADKITANADGSLNVSDEPIIPFIEGDGTGVDIWPAAKLRPRRRGDEARQARSPGRRCWPGEKAFNETGDWLPQETVDTFREYLIGIKGPLTTPVGGGIRSLNVALRQILDLYVCLRPVRWFTGVPSPGQAPRAGRHGDLPREHRGHLRRPRGRGRHRPTAEAVELLHDEFGWNIRCQDSGIGIKPVSRDRLRSAWSGRPSSTRSARGRKSVTLVHKGNIRSSPRAPSATGATSWCARSSPTWRSAGTTAAASPGDKILVKDTIADITLQQVLTRPEEFDVIATTNLNGDYLSDALAAQVGGIGIAPGGNINYVTGHGIFEATHGTAPKYAGQDKVNPGR